MLWPVDFRDAVTFCFGKNLSGGLYAVVNRRVDHAFEVWGRRYPMNPEQDTYAWTILTHSVLRAARSCDGMQGVKNEWAYRRAAVVRSMESIVNDPAVHDGFKRRASELVDVKELLSQL